MNEERIIDESNSSFNDSKLRASRARNKRKGNTSKLSLYETNMENFIAN